MKRRRFANAEERLIAFENMTWVIRVPGICSQTLHTPRRQSCSAAHDASEPRKLEKKTLYETPMDRQQTKYICVKNISH